jgi:copper(I)-binding protein
MTFVRMLAAALVMALAPGLAAAHEFKTGAIEVTHPWSRATPKGAKVAGGFLAITNSGTADDRLVAVESASAGRVELHEMRMDDGVMKMRKLADGIALPAGKTVALEPGGLHVMFIEIKAPFAEGASIPATMVFEKAGRLDVTFEVEAAGTMGQGMEGHMGGQMGGQMPGGMHDAMHGTPPAGQAPAQ